MDTTTAQPEDTANADSGARAAGSAPSIYRPAHDRMLAGVASGLALSLGIDPLLVRIALVVLCFVGGIGLAIYLAGWLLIPDEGAERSIADGFLSDMRDWRQ
jgi:phage shock protein PspC (stress-responsive transcriptional regulator)